MNQVININLGGYPFTIDNGAYEALDKYLNTIELHFKDSEGCEEIISDIEGRMAELFQEELGRRSIVNMRDVESAISIMGTPEDFGAEDMGEEPNPAKSGSKSRTEDSEGLKFGKRFFRDPEDEQVAGVCSGLAAYLGIEDPLWVRLAFVLVTLSGGIGIPVYLIMWAITPEANSASDRLAMRGEKINVNNIGKKVEEEFERFSDKMNEWSESGKWEDWGDADGWKEKGKSWKKKFSSKKKAQEEDLMSDLTVGNN